MKFLVRPALIGSALTLTNALSLSVAATKPDDAIVVPGDFVGFGIESVFLNNFDNDFSDNLVSALAARMSKPPIIRVGGTSGDTCRFDPRQAEPRACLSKPCGGSDGTYLLGPSFFPSYQRFKDARITLQAPMENPINETNTLDYVWQAWNDLEQGGGGRVAATALGNEVEYIYKESAQKYVDAALSLQGSIVKNLSLSGDAARIFEVGNTASGSFAGDTLYHVDDILNAGINKNGLISGTAGHLYQVTGSHEWTDATMQRLIINHTAIAKGFQPYMSSLKASHDKNFTFSITEDAAVIGGAPINFSGGFGYTLWAVDFNLLAMSRGVARVANLAARPGAKRAFWSPDDTWSAD